MQHTKIADLPNLGPKSQQILAQAGIHNLQELRQLGAVVAYARCQHVTGNVSLNLLWALEGALTGLSWQEVAREHRASLLLALEQFLSQPQL
jgi:DNA transformation protein